MRFRALLFMRTGGTGKSGAVSIEPHRWYPQVSGAPPAPTFAADTTSPPPRTARSSRAPTETLATRSPP